MRNSKKSPSQNLAAILCLLLTVATTMAESRLFILSGQSNMVKLNADKYFTPLIKEALPGDEIIVVKEAEGAQSISRWYRKWKPWAGRSKKEKTEPVGDLFDSLMSAVKAASPPGKTYASVTLIWMQGEADARPVENSRAYASNLKGLIAQFREELHRPDLMVVLGRINRFGIGDSKKPGWEAVREAQVSVAESDPLVEWVDLDDLGKDLHYDREGYEKMGERFAEKAIGLLGKPIRRKHGAK